MEFLNFVSGLKTALIEADDFASGTSSRSTKLIHGGVRYLQKAILGVCSRSEICNIESIKIN